MKKFFYILCRKSGVSDLGVLLQKYNIQILAYHGICDSEYASRYYFPNYFTYRENFIEQMNYLRNKMKPIGLLEAVDLIKNKRVISAKSVVVTFDDGYMNNLTEAIPILNEFKIPATIFLSTEYVTSGELFPFDKYRLLLFWAKKGMLDGAKTEDLKKDIPLFKSTPFDKFNNALNPYWKRFESRLEKKQVELICPVDLKSIKNLNSSDLSLGAHTVRHVVLSNENSITQAKEIIESVEFIKQITGSSKIMFCYPVGQKNCFNDQVVNIIKKTGCFGAVTSIAGSNTYQDDIFLLKRRSIGLYHTFDIFLAELGGIREKIYIA